MRKDDIHISSFSFIYGMNRAVDQHYLSNLKFRVNYTKVCIE